jgi:outer membrane lipoprotein-sorting protein
MRPTLRGVLLLFCGAFPLISYAQQPTVDGILKRVGATYQNLHSYQITAEKITEAATVGAIHPEGGGRVTSNFHESKNTQIVLAVADPGEFRLDVKEEGGGLLLVSDGQTKWTYLSKRKQYTEEAGSDPPEILKSYRNLLVERFRGLSDYSSAAVLEKDNQLKVGSEKIPCYVIKIQTPNGENDLWVDKDRYIVWKSRHIGPSSPEGISFQTIVTVNLSEAKTNTELDKGTFQFTPPDKASKVSSLQVQK